MARAWYRMGEDNKFIRCQSCNRPIALHLKSKSKCPVCGFEVKISEIDNESLSRIHERLGRR